MAQIYKGMNRLMKEGSCRDFAQGGIELVA
jgi:hypothetical protein